MIPALDRRLLSIVQEQQSQRDSRDLTSKCRRLLATLQEGVSSPIDVLYVLKEGEEGKELFIDGNLDVKDTMYFNPHEVPPPQLS